MNIWDVKFEAKPGNPEDVEDAWVRIGSYDIGLPITGDKIVQLGSGFHKIQIRGRGRPDGVWNVKVSSEGLEEPGEKSHVFSLYLSPIDGDGFLGWILKFK
jgi:hypothetical protein